MKKIAGIIIMTGLVSLTAGAEKIFSTDFSSATQAGGLGTPITMGGTANHVTVSPLTAGSGIVDFRYDTTSSNNPSDGNGPWKFASEGAGTNPSTTLSQAVANNEYFQFTVSSCAAQNYDSFSFIMRQFGFGSYAGVTLRSSADNYASDLVTVTNPFGSAASADLSSIAAFDNLTNVTFRIYLYDEYSGNNNRRLGIDNIEISATPNASILFDTTFTNATQSGGVGTAIMMGGTTNGVTVSTLTAGSGAGGLQYDTTSSNSPSDGNGPWKFVAEGVGTNPSSNLTQAVANNEYFQFTVSSTNELNYESFSFDMGKFGFGSYAGVTLRSSVDNYTADLVTVTNDWAAGLFLASVNVWSDPAFKNLTSITFRFYLYDAYSGQNNRRLGVDNIRITGSSGTSVTLPSASLFLFL